MFHLRDYDADADRRIVRFDRRVRFGFNQTVAFEEWWPTVSDASGGGEDGAPPRDDDNGLFVSVASYRDDRCRGTLASLFAAARHPLTVFVGLVDQRVMGIGVAAPLAPARPAGHAPDTPCFDAQTMCRGDSVVNSPRAGQQLAVLCAHFNHIRIAHVPSLLAKGPTFGRFIAGLMRRQERFFLMVDSHTHFTGHWDVRLLGQLERAVRLAAHSRGAVLSSYPLDSDEDPSEGMNGTTERNATWATYLCCESFLQTGIPRLRGITVPIRPGRDPVLQPWAAAGFLFGPSDFVDEVPFDPHLDFLFDGEEILYSARLWTHGWDMYAPAENIVYHHYARQRRRRSVYRELSRWEDAQLRSTHRVQLLLRLSPLSTNMLSWSRLAGAAPPQHNSRVFKELDTYGLGLNRTLQQYWDFAGLDPQRRLITKDWCRRG